MLKVDSKYLMNLFEDVDDFTVTEVTMRRKSEGQVDVKATFTSDWDMSDCDVESILYALFEDTDEGLDECLDFVKVEYDRYTLTDYITFRLSTDIDGVQFIADDD